MPRPPVAGVLQFQLFPGTPRVELGAPLYEPGDSPLAGDGLAVQIRRTRSAGREIASGASPPTDAERPVGARVTFGFSKRYGNSGH